MVMPVRRLLVPHAVRAPLLFPSQLLYICIARGHAFHRTPSLLAISFLESGLLEFVSTMEMMVMESPPEFCRHMVCSSYSDGVSSSGEFSLPRSPSIAGGISSPDHGFLITSTAAYSDEMVRGLISDLESTCLDLQREAAMGLRLLAKHSAENRLRIARAGAVAPLVSLLSHPDPQLQEHGVTAILNLSLCDENKEPIVAAGAVRHLVCALRSGTPAARENAACALLRLAQLDDLRSAIGRSGAIPPLVGLLETGGFRGKKDAATALFALLAAEENKARAVEAGIVRPLLELMADPESGMVDKAAYVLHRVLSTPEGRAATVDEGGVPVLVEIVEAGSRRQKEVAMLSLLEICEESAINRKMVVREGAIPPLVALSQSSSRKTKEKAEALIELLRQPTTTSGCNRRKPME
ncbi:U-box domain-containing protein 4-like isoform X2 [Canna indica]|uniref:RING-type E3 ubiquitin transferase n=1 Tax=Canna indica TaxID=4628 RepID=A0AAQ3KXN9_9LILI|nr:U-box domain-containing protein 4-like isoform X2 [Canna indica]